MRRLCLGGTFNPIHYGHLRCADAVAQAAGFDRVVLIPAAASPHRLTDADLASADDRLAMCCLAATDTEFPPGRFEVNDLELRRGPPSYTIDTVRALRRSGAVEVHWLIGADQLAALPRWRDAEVLLREASMWIMARPGHRFDWDALPEPFRRLKGQVVTAPLIEISATDIRRRVACGESIADWVPAGVAGYIAERGLYRPGPPQDERK